VERLNPDLYPEDGLKSIAERLKISSTTLQNTLHPFTSQYHIKEEISKSGKIRKCYAPHKALLSIQRRINQYILNAVAIPESMHGYRKKRSILTNAACHRDKKWVAKFDIKDFFPNIHYVRINKIFLSLGFLKDEANLLTRLTTVDNCLPHGFATSPRLAVITLINVDKRLKGALKSFNLVYTFYSDDITISGNCDIKKFENLIIKIFKQEGFAINKKKIFYYGNKSRQEVTGIVVNKQLNLPIETRERLEAILHNCLKLGAQTQIDKYWKDFGPPKKGGKTLVKFRERLLGKINHLRLVNHKSVDKLITMLKQIDWS